MISQVGSLNYRVPSIVHGCIINKLALTLRVLSRALTRPPADGSRPSPAPAHRSFLRAPSTPHGTSCSSPEEEDTQMSICVIDHHLEWKEKHLDHFNHSTGGVVFLFCAVTSVSVYGSRSWCSLHCFRSAYLIYCAHCWYDCWTWPHC